MRRPAILFASIVAAAAASPAHADQLSGGIIDLDIRLPDGDGGFEVVSETVQGRPMKTFKNSGDLGDIVYALPTIRALGGGILYLDVAGGESEPACRSQCIDRKTKFNCAGFDFIAPLLRRQPYVSEVAVWSGETVDVNLDRFRYKFADGSARSRTHNLLDLHLDAFGLPPLDPNAAWLELQRISMRVIP
jgi:hypothetical protein